MTLLRMAPPSLKTAQNQPFRPPGRTRRQRLRNGRKTSPMEIRPRHRCLSIVGIVAIINPIHPGCSNFARSWLVLIRPVTFFLNSGGQRRS